MVKLRQRWYASLEDDHGACRTMFCGSKREGLTLPFENDYDKMFVYNSIECRDVFDDNSRNDGLIKFQLVILHNTAPGYTLLKCISLNSDALSEFVRECLVEVEYGTNWSSDSWKQRHKENLQRLCSFPRFDGLFIPNRDNIGPSCPFRDPSGFLNSDCVDAIQCHCPQLTTCWRNRVRLYDWPTSELIDTVSSLEAHVVPIGYKDSPLQFLEWRICFTKAEIRLIESLNDCQIKLIILLKMIAKHELQPVCKEMTTYVMKNLVLWMAEKYPSETFVEDRLLVLLKHSLKLLKRCIMDKKLPSYMIEERNLFADRISDVQGTELCQKIEMLFHEGAKMLLRCPKIRDGLNLFHISHDRFYLFSGNRRFSETMWFHICHATQLLTNDPNLNAHQIIEYLCTQDFVRQNRATFVQFVVLFSLDVLGAVERGENLSNAAFDNLKQYLS